MKSITSTIPIGIKRAYLVPSYTIRFTYPFSEQTYKYVDTHQKVDFRGQPLDQEKFEQFWKQVYLQCSNFYKLQRYNIVPKISSYFGIGLFILGVVLLIIGILQIEKSETLSTILITAAGFLVIFSFIQYFLVKWILHQYYNHSLYIRYEEAIIRAIHDNLDQFLNMGLKWKTGGDGFRCIEFSYVTEETSTSGITTQTQPNTGKLETNIYTETGDMLKKENNGDQSSSMDMRSFFNQTERGGEGDSPRKIGKNLRSKPFNRSKFENISRGIDISEIKEIDMTTSKALVDESALGNIRTLEKELDTSSHLETITKDDESPTVRKGVRIISANTIALDSSPVRIGVKSADNESKEEEEAVKGI